MPTTAVAYSAGTSRKVTLADINTRLVSRLRNNMATAMLARGFVITFGVTLLHNG